MDDAELVAREYADESRFAARRAAWRDLREAPNAWEEALADVPDLDRGLGELARVLTDDGHLVAATQSLTITFPDHDRARAYVAASITRRHLADRLPPFDGPLRCTARQTVFVASRPLR